MEKHGVVPDLITAVPPEVVSVKYGDVSVDMGNELTPTQVKDAPSSVKWNADANSLYSIFLICPDAPSRADPKFGPIMSWGVYNIPGCDITKGDIIAEYIGSGAPKGSGLHRYVFLVYKQPKRIDPKPDQAAAVNDFKNFRSKVKIEKLAEKHNLGSPFAGNFFQAQYDDYVPILHERFRHLAADFQ